MAYLLSRPDDAVLRDVFRAYPEFCRPLLDYHQALLRGPSPLTVAERELIAAYVSGLNACGYGHGVHHATAQAFGIGKGTLAALLADVAAAPVRDRLKPFLRYVGKLTASRRRSPRRTPGRCWLRGGRSGPCTTVPACGLVNLMNRLVEGLGITAGEDYFRAAARGLAAAGGYSGLKELL